MRIKTYKIIVALLALVLAAIMIFSLIILYKHDIKSQDEKYQLVVENERLRSFNVRRERRLKWMNEPKSINLNHVSQAFHILGTKPSVVAALLYSENGPEYFESGSLDRTSYFAQNFPIEQWSSLEGSRTLNRMAWNWILEDSKRSHAFFLYASKPYTALSVAEQKSWANNMVAAEKRFRTEIADFKGNTVGNMVENTLVMAIRTPTFTVSGTIVESKKKKKRTIFVK